MPKKTYRFDTRRTFTKPDGTKEIHHIRADSEEELNEKIAYIQGQLDALKEVYKNPSFNQIAEIWLQQEYGDDYRREKEYRTYIKHLNNELGKMKVASIKKQDFINAIRNITQHGRLVNAKDMRGNPIKRSSPLGKSTVRKIINTGKNILACAADMDIPVHSFYLNNIKVPATAQKAVQRRALKYEEICRIIEMPHRAQTAAMVMLFCGLRRGECLALRWKNIDLKKEIISVREFAHLMEDNNTFYITDYGKTRNAVRNVPIPKVLLKHLKKACVGKSPDELITTDRKGKIHTDTSWKRMWDSYLSDLNVRYGYDGKENKNRPGGLEFKIENFTAYNLRHTYATLMFYQQINVFTAQKYMGHEDISVLSSNYIDFERSGFEIEGEFAKKLLDEFKIPSEIKIKIKNKQ